MTHPSKTVLSVLALALIACTQQPTPPENFSRAGYFLDKPGNRVLTIELIGDATPEEAKAHADSLPYTPGQITSIYFYPSNVWIPRDGVSLAESFNSAIDVIHEATGSSQWRYVFQRGFIGAPVFHDCEAEPEEILCLRR